MSNDDGTDKQFFFNVIPQGNRIPADVRYCAFLNKDKWDDWGKYCTQFYLTVIDTEGTQHKIGCVKIGEIDLKPHGAKDIPKGHRRPAIPDKFERLDESFFSLGQEEEFYLNLQALQGNLREIILEGLRDVAYDKNIWVTACEQLVTTESLLRGISEKRVEGQFRRIAHGGAHLTPYSFSFAPPKRWGDGKSPYELEFIVTPESKPPTNVHVLIGRNGVGKTYLMDLMCKALVATDATARQSGSFSWDNKADNEMSFANLVSVSFSAFDESELLPEGTSTNSKLKYSYIGLRRNSDKNVIKTKTPKALTNEFIESLSCCQIGSRHGRWLSALKILESDPIFKMANLKELISKNLKNENEREHVFSVFKKLSSGHKIIILTLTRLVETVEEKTLVLIDEPEAHLHPPLLSAFVRSLSQLLVNRNGVAIISTHSPVILQEVPRSCAWILSRIGREAKAERPRIETFGENVSILSGEVFQLELTQSGFHSFLEEVVAKKSTYAEAIEDFNGQLGTEAKAVIQAMLLEKPAADSGDVL